MKFLIHAATASALIAVGSAAAHAASDEAVHPVMVLQHDPALPEKLRRTTAACVQLAQAGRFEDAIPFCNLAIRYSEQGSPGASVDTSLGAAAARTNRAVVSWLLGRDERAAADMAVAAAQSPGASFVRRNLAVMGLEPPATTLAGGAAD
jgi:hypothetical protein